MPLAPTTKASRAMPSSRSRDGPDVATPFRGVERAPDGDPTEQEGPMEPGTPDAEWREDCAPRRALEIFSAKWTSMALHALHARHGGDARTGALGRSLPGISKKMLAQTLREMEGSGLVTRHEEGGVPPAVRYRLTPLGARFVGLVELVYDWGRSNADALDALGPRPSSRRA